MVESHVCISENLISWCRIEVLEADYEWTEMESNNRPTGDLSLWTLQAIDERSAEEWWTK